MLINLVSNGTFKIRNVESICPYTVWNTIIKVGNFNALLVPLMVQDNTGQVPTKSVIEVIEKYLEHLLESLSLTFHEQVHVSFLNKFEQLTNLSPS